MVEFLYYRVLQIFTEFFRESSNTVISHYYEHIEFVLYDLVPTVESCSEPTACHFCPFLIAPTIVHSDLTSHDLPPQYFQILQS
jgi:hypothetical protein